MEEHDEKLEKIGEHKLGIDQETYDLCMDKLREIYKAVTLINCEAEFSELDNGLPLLIVSYDDNVYDAAFLITLIPLSLGGRFRLIAQIGAPVVDDIQDENREEIEKLSRFLATTLNLSTPVLSDGSLIMKYLMFVDHEDKIDQVTLLRTLEIMAIEANDMLLNVTRIQNGRTADDIINGALDLAEEQLSAKDGGVGEDADDDEEDY